MTRKIILRVSLVGLITTGIFFTGWLNLKRDDDCSGPITKRSPSSVLYQHSGWEFLKTRDPETNSIPDHIKARELDFVSTISTRNEYSTHRESLSMPSQYRDQSWESLGPDEVCGRVLALGIDIENENILLAGTASGGMWRSIDEGQTWTKATPLNAVQSVTCLAQDPRPGKTGTWYYGTGELTSTTDRQFSIFPRTMGFGNGIFKSTDNGESWEVLASTTGGITGDLTESFQGIWDIKVDPHETEKDIIYAACYGAIMRSENGGETWTKVLGDPVYKSFCSDVEVAPDGSVFAALSTFTQDPSGNLPVVSGVYRSDDGLTWTDITPDIYPTYTRTVKLEVPEANPSLLYVLTETPEPDTDPEFGFSASYHHFLKATRFGTDSIHWEIFTDNLPGKGEGNIIKGFLEPAHGYNSIGGYAMVLESNPDHINSVFIGGTNLYRNDTAFIDSTFTHLLGGYPYDTHFDNLHPDIHALVFSHSDPRVLFAGCDGGIYKTMDCMSDSAIWEHISEGIISTQFYWVGIDHMGVSDDFIIGGCQDNAIYYRDRFFPASEWAAIMGGDGLTTIVSDNKTFAVISVYDGNIYTLTFDESLDIENVYYQRPDFTDNGDFIFYTHFVLDPNNNKTLYLAANNKILRKDDMESAANDSTLINDGWTWLDHTGLAEDEFITALSISKEPANVLYYGSHKGRVFRMENAHQGNPEATEITGTLFPFNAYTGCIEMDPNDAENMFVVFSNYNVPSIFHSEDGGQSWTHVSGNLEEYPDGSGAGPSVRWLKMIHYPDGLAYFAATSAGLFSTYELNGNQTQWLMEGEDIIGNCIVDHIDARQTDGWIVIATQGSGVYASTFEPSGVSSLNSSDLVLLLQNYPNPVNGSTRVRYQLPDEGWTRLSVYDLDGKEIDRIVDQSQSKGEHWVVYDASRLENGCYTFRLSVGNQSDTRKFIVAR